MATPCPPRSYLRCLTCGKATDPLPDDVLQALRDCWPSCCGEVMAPVATRTLTPKDPPDPA